MPIEIRELVIKATVTQDGQQGSTSGGGSNNAVAPQEEIINTCVEKVLEIIKDRYER